VQVLIGRRRVSTYGRAVVRPQHDLRAWPLSPACGNKFPDLLKLAIATHLDRRATSRPSDESCTHRWRLRSTHEGPWNKRARCDRGARRHPPFRRMQQGVPLICYYLVGELMSEAEQPSRASLGSAYCDLVGRAVTAILPSLKHSLPPQTGRASQRGRLTTGVRPEQDLVHHRRGSGIGAAIARAAVTLCAADFQRLC
jgi:hypothetical protein